MDIIPLILVIIVLLLLLCVQPYVVTDHTKRTREPSRSVTGTPDEEERLLSRDREQVGSSRRDDRLRRPGDDAFDRLAAETDYLYRESPRKAEGIETTRKNLKELQQDPSTSSSQNAELRRQYETLLRELEGVRHFLNTADTFADSDVIQLLQKLNAELQHIATMMVDRVVSVFKLDAMTSDPEQQVVNRVSESIGSTFVGLLRAVGRDESESQVYFQIAFQAYLTRQLCWIVSSWTLDEGRNTFICEIYQRLRDAEKQAVSGRWRSLMHTHTLPTCVSDPNSFVTPIIAGLSDILLAAGCAASQSYILSELSSMFGDKILSVISLAASLNQTIGGVISGDFETFVARPGETFRGELMEDMDDSNGTRGGAQTVLCTSEMGLMKRVQLGTGERETRTVIKAKVILMSFLDTEA